MNHHTWLQSLNKIISWLQFVLPIQPWTWYQPLEYADSLGAIRLRESDFPSPINYPQCYLGVEVCDPTPLKLNVRILIGLVLSRCFAGSHSCFEFMSTGSRHVQKILFSSSKPQLLGLQSVSTLPVVPDPHVYMWKSPLQLNVNWHSFFVLWLVVSFCINYHRLCKEETVMRSQNYIIYGKRNRNLESRLILCLFSRIIVDIDHISVPGIWFFPL